MLALGALVALLIGFTGGAGASGHDLVLTKSDSPDPVTRGSNLTYTIQVQNNTAAAEGVVVTDTLPSRVDFVSATPSQGTPCVRSGDTVTCALGTMAAGTTATVTIVVRPKQAGTISNTAVVASAPSDLPTANNSDTESTTVLSKGQAKKKPRLSCATPTITGTPGADVLVGTNGTDVILALAGPDRVFSGGGRDLICAGGGRDLVKAGPGGDIVIGGKKRDRLFGGRGGDLLKGKAGRDKLRGNRGNDALNGGRHRDNCKGGPGRDKLIKCP